MPSIIKNFVTGFPMFSLHLLSAQERGRRSYRIIHYIVIITNFFIISLIKNNIHFLYQYISAIDDFALYFKKNKNDTIKKRVKKIGTSSSRKFVTSQHILLKCWSEQFVFKSYNQRELTSLMHTYSGENKNKNRISQLRILFQPRTYLCLF